MMFKVTTLLILLCVSSRNNCMVASLPEEQDLSIETELKALNKPPLKTIQLEGEIIDCIDFNKQPSFDHPLLKGHKIQMLPKSYVARRMKQLETARSAGKACPIGTVPIRRTTEEDLVMADALNHTGVFASNAKRSHVNSDRQPRLFIFWMVHDGNLKTGCYDVDCKGFVQVDSKIAPGHILEPASTYGGPIYDVKIKLFQDRQTGKWVFYFSEQDIIVGYLPKELFPYLKYGAKTVAWGGEAYPGNDGIRPPMGSGHKPDGQYNHAAYFKNLTYFAHNYIRRHPSYYNTGYHTAGTDCYGLQNGSDYTQPWRSSFLYGGPGGHCGN